VLAPPLVVVNQDVRLRESCRHSTVQKPTGITAYLTNGGKLEIAQQMAAHESARTTGCMIGAAMRSRSMR
jgi:hypothetical protein